MNDFQIILLILFAPFVVYVVVRIVTTAYFKSKGDFLKELWHGNPAEKARRDREEEI